MHCSKKHISMMEIYNNNVDKSIRGIIVNSEKAVNTESTLLAIISDSGKLVQHINIDNTVASLEMDDMCEEFKKI